jgi:serine protease AprX
MKGWKAAVVALFLIGIMAGMTAAAPAKPHVNSQPMQKNYGLLTPGLFKKVQRMGLDQEISTVIMFDNPQDQEKALKVLKLMGAEIKYKYKVIPAVAIKMKVKDLLIFFISIFSDFYF